MKQTPNSENPLVNIIINIVLPVLVLKYADKLEHQHSALIGLGVALALPIGYGLWDYFSNGKKNFIALLGVINVGFTGGFAVMQLNGFWFAVKEALVPLVIGLSVIVSQALGKPVFGSMLKSTGVLNWDLLETRAQERSNLEKLEKLLRNCNLFFAASFFISSFLNLVLALYIFKPLDHIVSEAERQQLLNHQIGEMTWMGYVVIALPLMIFMGFIFYYFLKGVKNLTGLQLDDLAGESETKVSS